MSKNKVICPCGKQMKISKAAVFYRWDVKKEKQQDGRSKRTYVPNDKKLRCKAHYQCSCGWRAPDGFGATEAEALAEAYRLATLRDTGDQSK